MGLSNSKRCLKDKSTWQNTIMIKPGASFKYLDTPENTASYSFVFDCLQDNVCTQFQNYFERKDHGQNTRNSNLAVKVLRMKTEFGFVCLYQMFITMFLF